MVSYGHSIRWNFIIWQVVRSGKYFHVNLPASFGFSWARKPFGNDSKHPCFLLKPACFFLKLLDICRNTLIICSLFAMYNGCICVERWTYGRYIDFVRKQNKFSRKAAKKGLVVVYSYNDTYVLYSCIIFRRWKIGNVPGLEKYFFRSREKGNCESWVMNDVDTVDYGGGNIGPELTSFKAA